MTSVARRPARTIGGWCESGAVSVCTEDRVEDTRVEAGAGVQACPVLRRSGEATRLGAILAQPAGMASAE